MNATKEKILMTALRLFARDGYEAVSVSTLAGEIGMTKGALYKHYKSKRDIFDSIVERMYRIDAEHSRQYAVPEESYEANAAAYGDVSCKSLRDFTLAQFDFWTGDDFARDFRRMLTLEQYRDPEIGELYRNCLTAGPVAYVESIFRVMVEKGRIAGNDPERLALEFYAPFYLLVSLSDTPGERENALQLLGRHVEDFMSRYTVKEKGKEEPKWNT